MSTGELIRIFFISLISFFLAFAIFMRHIKETYINVGETPEKQYAAATPIDGWILPIFFIFLLITLWITAKGNVPFIVSSLFSLLFGFLLEMSIYFVLLFLALPILRKYICARTCAILWLIPNFLYLTVSSWMKLPEPRWVIRLPGNWISAAVILWAVGFLCVMFWKTMEHLIFRRRLLKNAWPVRKSTVLILWKQEQQDMQIKKANYRLMISPEAVSPLSIGLFPLTTRVVLPEKEYTCQELSLIFRHELTHIRRNDTWTKFFITFCTAMCWFNPLMWMAMRRSAEDLELSCDEMVLMNADAADRHTYAELILNSAADERGYTTCLSASAAALRYRLKSIVTPRKRFTGAVITGLFLFTLLTASGHVAAAYDERSGLDMIFQGSTETVEFSSCCLYENAGSNMYTSVDETALNEYLSSMQLCQLTGNYSFSDRDPELTVVYRCPDDTVFGVVIRDHYLKVAHLRENYAVTYYLEEAVDWEYLYSLLKE